MFQNVSKMHFKIKGSYDFMCQNTTSVINNKSLENLINYIFLSSNNLVFTKISKDTHARQTFLTLAMDFAKMSRPLSRAQRSLIMSSSLTQDDPCTSRKILIGDPYFCGAQKKMRHINLFCGAPDTVRHRNSVFLVFLWHTRGGCATEIRWAPHPASLNHWFHYLYGAHDNVRHRSKTLCGAPFLVRHRIKTFCGAPFLVHHRNNTFCGAWADAPQNSYFVARILWRTNPCAT
jgi:hypothetical protein